MPSWLPAVLTIADFIAQRVDQAGPISFEPPEKQPPERTRTTVPPAEEESTDAASKTAPSDEGPKAQRDDSALGFQARGDPPDSIDQGRDADEFGADALAGGGTDPSGGGGSGGGGSDNEDESEPRCSFRSMRVKDRPTTYEA